MMVPYTHGECIVCQLGSCHKCRRIRRSHTPFPHNSVGNISAPSIPLYLHNALRQHNSALPHSSCRMHQA